MKSDQLFMMVFRFEPNFEYQPTAQEQKEISEQWGSFIGNIAIKEKLVSTHQLGFEGKQIFSDLSTKDEISITDRKTIGGNMIVKANSIEEATTMAKESPILKIGGSVEVRSIIPMEN